MWHLPTYCSLLTAHLGRGLTLTLTLTWVEGFLARVPAHARVVAGGAAIPGPGFFIAPTVVAGLRQEDELVQQEVSKGVVSETRPLIVGAAHAFYMMVPLAHTL